MQVDKNTFDLISKYLNGRETEEERAALYRYYDQLGEPSAEMGIEEILRAQYRGEDIFNAQFKRRRSLWQTSVFWYGSVAAVLVCGLAIWAFLYQGQGTKLVPLAENELQRSGPAHNGALITRSTGESLELNDLSENDSASIGGMTIKKDSLGQLAYTDKPQSSDRITSTLSTTKSSQYSIVLSDGSKAYLNANSSLTYPEHFGSGDRQVELVGEGYFEVAKTADHRKFIVKTRGQQIEVLGTKFNVSAYPKAGKVATTLAEGSVAVHADNRKIPFMLLKPNEQAILGDASISKAKVDAQYIISWKDGFFIFDGKNADDVLGEIGDWYDVGVEYRSVKKIEYAGRIPKNVNLSQLIKLLSYADIHVQAYKDTNNHTKLIFN